MTILTFVSIIALILGIVLIVLVALNLFRSYKTGLIVGSLLLFAISVAAYLSDNVDSTSNVDSQASTPTGAAVAGEPEEGPVSPISPLSPIPTPEPVLKEVGLSEIGFEGCLLFISDRTGDLEIFEMRQEADNIQQLTNSSGLDIDPVWSPDGTEIAFASNREPEAGLQIYMMKADGSDQHLVGALQPGDNNHPSWSPDGSRLVFQGKQDTNGNPLDDSNDIFIMNKDGSELNLLVFHSAEDVEPVWSPDGERIAFISERSEQDEVYVMNPDGSDITQVTTLNVIKTGLNWSGDSRSVIFEGSGDIYMVDVETKETVKVIGFKDSNESTPVWAQDKAHIIFSSDQTSNWNLYLADLSTPGELSVASLTTGANLNRSTSWFPCE